MSATDHFHNPPVEPPHNFVFFSLFKFPTPHTPEQGIAARALTGWIMLLCFRVRDVHVGTCAAFQGDVLFSSPLTHKNLSFARRGVKLHRRPLHLSERGRQNDSDPLEPHILFFSCSVIRIWVSAVSPPTPSSSLTSVSSEGQKGGMLNS